jgi:hypothetical protein
LTGDLPGAEVEEAMTTPNRSVEARAKLFIEPAPLCSAPSPET